jgi:hypothetical protein
MIVTQQWGCTMRNDPSFLRSSERLAKLLRSAALVALLAAFASLPRAALADVPLDEAYAAEKPAEPAPEVLPEGAKPLPGVINLFPMHSTWPKAPYPVEPRDLTKPQAGQPYPPPRRLYREPPVYRERAPEPVYVERPRPLPLPPKADEADIADYPPPARGYAGPYRDPKERIYDEPPYAPKARGYAEPHDPPKQRAYAGPYRGPRQPAYAEPHDAPKEPVYEPSNSPEPYHGAHPPRAPRDDIAADRYPGGPPPRLQAAKQRYDAAPDYPPPGLAKRGYGPGPGAPDLELPLAPDFELNRHRGFGRLFPVQHPYAREGKGLPAQGSSLAALRALGQSLREKGEPDHPSGDSAIPAGYTFLGQFVDHDLTLDLSSDLAKGVRGDEVFNSRTPELDLDNVYGGGPIATPYLYKLPYLRTGKLLAGEGAYVRHDLPRAHASAYPGPNGGPPTALIGDPRNDENVIIAQLHAAFIALHNRTVDLLVQRRFGRERYKYCKSNICSIYRLADALPAHAKLEVFQVARDHVLHYYHRVIAEDFLPRLIGEERVKDIFARGRDFYFPNGFRGKDGRLRDPFIPVEFAAAAFRFGHSEVRYAYQIKQGQRIPLFRIGGGPRVNGAEPVSRRQLVDWRYFFDLDPVPPPGFNYARRIDPLVTAALHQLNRTHVVGPSDLGSLPARNLARGRVYYLPSGQAVAEQILPALEARGALNGRYARGPRRKGGGWQAFLLAPDPRIRRYLQGEETPLWYYVLQEAEIFGIHRPLSAEPAYAGPIGGARYQRVSYDAGRGYGQGAGGNSLGPVGGAIVGEVLVGLMEHFKEKTGKGLAYRPYVRGSTSGPGDDYGRGDDRPRYLMRNLLLDAGVVDIY